MMQTEPERPAATATECEDNSARSQILRRELERRLEFFEEADEEVFGRFTAIDWAVCTILFFAIPLVIVWLAR